jgi:hypothetical protein
VPFCQTPRHPVSPTAAALRHALLRSLLVAAAALAGCSRSDDAALSKPPPSPRETISRLIAARDQRQYQVMRELTVPEHAQDVVATLAAVDDFLSANEQLCNLVRSEIALGVADAIDQGQLAYHLDIFSRCVKLLDESVTGDEAEVSFLVDERLPARHAHLRRVGGQWRYDPGAGEFTKLGEAFERMAYGLRQVLDGLHRGQLSTERFRHNPQELIDEVRIRLLPGVKLLPQGPDSADGSRP